jgi:hypothetical protein
MKKKLIFLFTMLHLACFSQVEWAPIGSKWHYTAPYFDQMHYNVYGPCIYMESLKDSLIGGNSVRVLEIRDCNDDKFIARAFIWQNNDSIFYYHPDTEKFHLLYNFSAKAGDSIIVHSEKFHTVPAFLYPYPEDSITSFKYEVVKIDSIEVNGSWYKRQKIFSLDNDGWGFIDNIKESFIIEKLGSSIFFFGRSFYIYPEQSLGELRCYSDETTIYQSPEWNFNCDTVLSAKVTLPQNEGIRFYPNPAKSKLTIESDTRVLSVSIYNIAGRIIRQIPVNENTHMLIVPVESLQPGTYIVKVVTTNRVGSVKFIKK